MDHDSPPGKENVAAAPPSASSSHKYAEGDVHDLMPLYYARLFPAKHMMHWLAYGNDSKNAHADQGFMQRREFCFTLEGDIFCRYQSFRDDKELRAALKDKCPSKIDIGPVFNVDPQKRLAYGGNGSDRVFAPTERELVFDIDMTDYDDVRTCCSAASICNKCWPLMTVACKVIDAGLRQDFGFKSLLWVYSGRRGIHCWVCDKRARQLSNEARAAVAEYFSVYKGTDASGTTKRVSLTNPLHPALQRAYVGVLRPYWLDTILPEQCLLESEKHFEPILAMIPDQAVRERVGDAWHSGRKAGGPGTPESVARWNRLEQEVGRAVKQIKSQNSPDAIALRRCLNDIVFAHVYPRLDVEVSKHMNHLLKAPFCVHPKTGRVCVPIDPAECEKFDPLAVPTVAQLLNELDAAGPSAAAGDREEYEATSMKGAVDVFNRTFGDAAQAEARAELKTKAIEAANQPTMAW